MSKIDVRLVRTASQRDLDARTGVTDFAWMIPIVHSAATGVCELEAVFSDPMDEFLMFRLDSVRPPPSTCAPFGPSPACAPGEAPNENYGCVVQNRRSTICDCTVAKLEEGELCNASSTCAPGFWAPGTAGVDSRCRRLCRPGRPVSGVCSVNGEICQVEQQGDRWGTSPSANHVA